MLSSISSARECFAAVRWIGMEGDREEHLEPKHNPLRRSEWRLLASMYIFIFCMCSDLVQAGCQQPVGLKHQSGILKGKGQWCWAAGCLSPPG